MRKIVVLGAVVLALVMGCAPAPEKSEAPASGEGTEAVAAPAEPEAAAVEQEMPEAEAKPLQIGVMPKLLGIDYFNASGRGAAEAGAELGVEVDYDGPSGNDVQSQAEMLETWIAKKYDAICVAPNDPDAIAPVLKKARKRGIVVVAWDADAQAESRDFFCNQCTYEAIAKGLVDIMAGSAGPEAKYLILTGSLTAANQNIWMDEMEKYRQATYPGMTNLSETPKVSEESAELATKVTGDCLKAYPDLQGIYAITSQALPGAAEALRKAQAADKVVLTGLSTANMMREFVKDGTVKEFVLWNPVDLGYLAVHAAVARVRGELQDGARTFTAGRLGQLEVVGQEIILGPPIVFTAENIDNYDF